MPIARKINQRDGDSLVNEVIILIELLYFTRGESAYPENCQSIMVENSHLQLSTHWIMFWEGEI